MWIVVDSTSGMMVLSSCIYEIVARLLASTVSSNLTDSSIYNLVCTKPSNLQFYRTSLSISSNTIYRYVFFTSILPTAKRFRF